MDTTRFDTVIRGGTVVDGTGSAPYPADVGIIDGRIAEVGPDLGPGAEEIDATGKLVTPGFVDIHTHYDGQAVWDDELAPSAWHGVTTVLMGNCGVGFAPCRPDDRNKLIELMEGVEDIPAPVMHEGLTWEWESFPEYLDVLDQKRRDVDICAMVPHAPVRVNVMGERALRLEPATESDIARMREIAAEGLRAGAFGVSTSRTTNHQSSSGDYTPTLRALGDELGGLVGAIQDAGRGFLELVTELNSPEVLKEFEMLHEVVDGTGVNAYFSMTQNTHEPELWRELLAFSHEAVAAGNTIRPVVAPRPIGMLLGLEASQNPFAGTATYKRLESLPIAERVAEMRKPEVKAQILSEDPLEHSSWVFMGRIPYTNMYKFGSPPNYTPAPSESIQAIADSQGLDPASVAYDALLEKDGSAMLYTPFSNFADSTLNASREMLADRNTIMGLGDGGAHVGFILDAGFQTWMLTYWVRDQQAFPVEEAVRRMTSDTADAIGLTDRGRLKPGLRADINVIDFERLHAGDPYVARDLPLGGLRLLQKVHGYDVTMVEGQVTYRDGVATGAKPGRLVRSGDHVRSEAELLDTAGR